MSVKKKLGLRIKELRRQRNLTQAKLAEMVGINSKTQSFIETGRTYHSSETIENYAKAFNVDVSEVLYIGDIQKVEDDYLYALHKLINKATKKQIEHIYKHAKLVIEF